MGAVYEENEMWNSGFLVKVTSMSTGFCASTLNCISSNREDVLRTACFFIPRAMLARREIICS